MAINCRFGVFAIDSKDLYTCIIEDSVCRESVIERDQEVKEFKGIHKEGKSHKDVEYVYFLNASKVNQFPRDLEKHFPNLTYLVLSGCSIKEISKSDLKGLEGLIGLVIIYCELTSLPDDLFIEMSNLRIVTFYDSKIKFASSKLLKPLIGRENIKVELRINNRIDACYMPGEDESLESLEELMKLIDQKFDQIK